MDPEIARYMRTERKPGALDVHPINDALILSYEMYVQILGPQDKLLHGEKKILKKIIDLPMLNSRTDCQALAKEIVHQCDLIHHSRLSEVEQIIYYLKKRRLQSSSAHNTANMELMKNNVIEANYNNLSDYIDMLYEGMTEKVKGAQLIQALARDPENLDALAKNETLISALGRVLREDWKRSISLCTHLVFTFFCFSMYSSFHSIILKCKVGSFCMDIIDFELRRYDKWKVELEGGDLSSSSTSSDAPIIVKNKPPNSASMSEIPRSRIPEPVRPKSGHFNDVTINGNNNNREVTTTGEELTVSLESLDNDKRLNPEEKRKRFRMLVKKQEHLLRVAYYLLLNIAEDEIVEEKMSKRNIVGLLIKVLDRNNDDLLILVVTFLKKLSIMQCNKDLMSSNNIVEKLPKMLNNSKSPDLTHLTLKLLFNLSLDTRLRTKMIKYGLIRKVINFISDDRHQEIVLKLLYHFSYDQTDSNGDFSDFVGLIVDMLLLNVAGNENDKLMIALCINLAVDEKLSQEFVKENRLQALITRAFTFEDLMLMKLLRNISSNFKLASYFIEFVGDVAKAIIESKNQDFITECCGVLSNLHLPDLDWAEVFKHFGISEWIKNILSLNSTDPELILAIIVLLGTASFDENCSTLVCKESQLLNKLIDLLKTHQEDDEIVMQIVYVFYVTLLNEANIDLIINETDVPAYLIDLLQDNNKNIRNICNMCLNIISEHNATWAERIRIEKFRHHNIQWLQMVDSQQLHDNGDEEDDDDGELPPYLNTEYLSQAIIRPLTAGVQKINDLDLLDEEDLEFDHFSNNHKIIDHDDDEDNLDIMEECDMEDL